jgi:histidinol-phosphate aminotransferase
MSDDNQLSPFSRRSFLHLSAAAYAAMAFPLLTETVLAQVAVEREAYPSGAIRINSNENPLGPCTAARDAVTAVLPDSGRYQFHLTEELVKTFAQQQGLNTEYLLPVAGSSPALNFIVGALTGPKASYVAAEPGYDAVAQVARTVGARVVGVRLTKTWSHDVRAMLAAAPDAGVFYVCTPNNPTGTLTSHDDIEYLLEHKPKGSIVLVDEAYIHFSDAPSALDLVKADKDVIVLRTFSKLYGMAGLRCGFAIARPDLLKKVTTYGGWNPMPVTACAAATASLKEANLVQERKAINTGVRQSTFAWLDRNGYTYSPSVSNCFMLKAGKPAPDVIAAMAHQNVFIGRPWPSMPDWVRITVGTQPEMEQFQTAFQKVMKGEVVGRRHDELLLRNLDGIVLPA